MSGWAVIFDWFRTTPTYHAFSDERLNEMGEDGSRRSFTRCGRVVSSYDGEWYSKADWIPVRHARKFGKPCRRCYPVRIGEGQ